MALPLTDRGSVMMSWLPRHYQRSIDVQMFIDTIAREAERLEAARLDVLDQFFVQTATWGLVYWEESMQLPVEPVDELGNPLTDAERRTVILSRLRANKVESAAQWRGILDLYVADYSIRVDHTNAIIYVTISYNPSAYSEAQLEKLMESITPAHYTLNFVYTGFLADISAAEDPV